MRTSVNQIYIENLKLLESCFKDNPLAPLLCGLLSSVEARLKYYDDYLTPLEQGNISFNDLLEAGSNIADDLSKVTSNYNALLRRHSELLEQNQALQEKVEELFKLLKV